MATAEQVRRDLRIVLLGKTGSGKSATGNTIIGKERFLVDQSPSSVTTTSRKEMLHDDNRRISVIDTPGMFDTSMDQQDVDKEIKECIMKSVPGPHVFLLVLSTAVRFTKEEKEVFSWIKKNFGADAGQYTLAVFTHGDTLKGSIETYIGKNKDLQDVINDCKAGYTVFDNETMQNRTQVNELIEKIDQIVERNRGPYNSTKYEEVQKKLESDEMWEKVGGYVEKGGIELMKAAVITTAAVIPGAGVAAAVEEIGIGSYLLLSGGAAAAVIGRWMKPKPRSDKEK